mgnify:CR=1 FL=1
MRAHCQKQHSRNVAHAAELIAGRCDKMDSDKAFVCGLLHDIGRFEQLRRWDTFSDARSTNHAKLGAEVLFSQLAGTPPFEGASEADSVPSPRRNPGIAQQSAYA